MSKAPKPAPKPKEDKPPQPVFRFGDWAMI